MMGSTLAWTKWGSPTEFTTIGDGKVKAHTVLEAEEILGKDYFAIQMGLKEGPPNVKRGRTDL